MFGILRSVDRKLSIHIYNKYFCFLGVSKLQQDLYLFLKETVFTVKTFQTKLSSIVSYLWGINLYL